MTLNIFHNLRGINNMPDLEQHGIRFVPMVYEGQVYGPGEDRQQLPDPAMLLPYAEAAHAISRPLIVDLEKWPIHTGTDAEIERELDKHITVTDWVHDAFPGLRVGWYGELPIRDYWAIMRHHRQPEIKQYKDEFNDWKKKNARIRKGRDDDTGRFEARGLADTVDFVCPSVYTFYDTPDEWVIYAKAMIREARKYQKLVYPYIWPVYHQSNAAIGGTLIGYDFWKLQLQTVLDHADGVVIWGFGWAGHPSGQSHILQNWNDDWPWWRATVDVIEKRTL